MKVLHIQKVKGIAGSEKHLLTLIPELARLGYQAEMLVLANNLEQTSSFVNQMLRSSIPTEVVLMTGHLDLRIVLKIRRWIAQRRYDLVHTHLFHADLYGTLAARLAGVRVIISSKHGFAASGWRRYWPYKFTDRMIARLQQRIIVISRGIGDWLVENERLPRRKFELVYYGLDPSRFIAEADLRTPPFRTEKPVIGTVGRLIKQKAVDVLIQAFAEVQRCHPNAQLVIAGDGPEKSTLEALVENLGLADHVTFLGYRDDISTLMKHFDLFVFPTYGEGFGLVLLEAMAWEKAVVASRITSIPEIVADQDTGLLVPPGDPRSLAAAISVLLGDPERRRSMGARGRQRLDRLFSVNRMVQETARVYEEVLNPPASPPRGKE